MAHPETGSHFFNLYQHHPKFTFELRKFTFRI